jgi:hypothetical protein
MVRKADVMCPCGHGRFPAGASLVDSPYDVGVLARTETLLADLSRLRSARERLVAQLKAQTAADDIADVLVLNRTNEAAVFDAEIEKHRPLATQIDALCRESQGKLDELGRCAATLRGARGASCVR